MTIQKPFLAAQGALLFKQLESPLTDEGNSSVLSSTALVHAGSPTSSNSQVNQPNQESSDSIL